MVSAPVFRRAQEMGESIRLDLEQPSNIAAENVIAN
jgi:hypothetical protein